jgi:serine/threonine protein kinase
MAAASVRVLGRYALYGQIASGGMATVHLGRLVGPVGFSRTVAIKKLHTSLSTDPQFVTMFLDEARLAARITHPNVVATLDVVALQGELFLVMEHISGVSLVRLLVAVRERKEFVPPPIAAGIVVGVLRGLHAAHDAQNERGEPLGLVHRDVSPQNVLIGAEGVPRVIDFGVAKAAGRAQTTHKSQLKGKVSYMSPEQIHGEVDRRTDVYAASVVLWETLAGRRLFRGDSEAMVLSKVLTEVVRPPGAMTPDIPPALDAIVLKGLSRNPNERFQTARDMARAIEDAITVAGPSAIGEWVERLAGPELAERAKLVTEVESSAQHDVPPAPTPIVAPLPPSSLSDDDDTTVAMDGPPVVDPPTADGPAVAEGSLGTQMTSSASSLRRFVPQGRRRLVIAGAAGGVLLLLLTIVTCRGLGRTDDVASPAAMGSESIAPVLASAEPPSPSAASPAPSAADRAAAVDEAGAGAAVAPTPARP